MSAQITLKAETVETGLRLVGSAVVFAGGHSLTTGRSDLRGPIKVEPLFVLLARFKLSTNEIFELVEDGGVTERLHGLLDNGHKRPTHYLKRVFGGSPNKLFQWSERNGRFVVSFQLPVPERSQIRLWVDGVEVSTPSELEKLAGRYSTRPRDEEQAVRDSIPESEQSEIALYWGYRPTAHGDIRETLLQCQKRLDIAGIALTTITKVLNDPIILKRLARSLSDGDMQIRLMIVDDADHPRSREGGGAELRERLLLGRKDLRRFEESLTQQVGKKIAFELRTYPEAVFPRHFILRSDDTIYFGSYLSHHPGSSSYLLKLRDAGHGLYSIVSKELDHLLEASVPFPLASQEEQP